jgi:hypothetical protein
MDCPEFHRSLEIENLIGSTPAATLAGVLCQLRLADHYVSPAFPGDACTAGLTNAIATLERLAGGQAHV